MSRVAVYGAPRCWNSFFGDQPSSEVPSAATRSSMPSRADAANRRVSTLELTWLLLPRSQRLVSLCAAPQSQQQQQTAVSTFEEPFSVTD